MAEVIDEHYFTLEELAQHLQINPKIIAEWIKTNLLPSQKRGRRIQIAYQDIAKLLVQNPMVLIAGSSKGYKDGEYNTAKFNQPSKIVLDSTGTIYLADTKNNQIRKIAPEGLVTTLPDMEEMGCQSTPPFSAPLGLTLDPEGNIYVANSGNHTICKIDLAGEITTIAGGLSGYQDGAASMACFSNPTALAFDSHHNLYIADCNNNCIRKLTPEGQVSTFAGSREKGNKDGFGEVACFNHPTDLIIDREDNLYVADSDNRRICQITPEGYVVTLIGHGDRLLAQNPLSCPVALALDRWHNLYIADRSKSTLYCLNTDGTIESLASLRSESSCIGLAVDRSGNIYTAETGNHQIHKRLSIYTLREYLPASLWESLPNIKHPSIPKPTEPLPPVNELYSVYLDERNNPCGLIFLDQKAGKLGKTVAPEEVLAYLENSDDLARTCAATLLTTQATFRKPQLFLKIEAALLNLVADERRYKGAIDGYQESVEVLGRLATGAYLQLQKGRDLASQITNLSVFVDQATKNSKDEDILNLAIVSAPNFSFYLSLPQQETLASSLADKLLKVLGDRNRPTAQRLRCYKTLLWEKQYGQFIKPVFEQARKQAQDLLVDILIDTQEDPELHQYIRANLTNIAPDAIEKLQKHHILPITPIPEIKELMGWGNPEAEKLRQAAISVTPTQIRVALQDVKVSQISQTLAAIYLTPLIAKRGDWRAFAQALLVLIPRHLEYEFSTAGRQHKLCVGRVAAAQLLELLKNINSPDPKAQLHFLTQGLQLALDRGLSGICCADTPIWDYIYLFQALKANDLVTQLLTECLHSPWRAPIARYIAFQGLNSDAAREYADQVLLDPQENPGLRALFGNTNYSYQQPNLKAAFKSFVDTSQSPWQLLPNAPKDLPICEPEREVPLTWLVASVNAAEDRFTRSKATVILYLRLQPQDGTSHTSIKKMQTQVLALFERYPQLPIVLRKVADDLQLPNGGRQGAITLLSLLGAKEDTERIIAGVIEGGWTALKPFSNDWKPLILRLNALAEAAGVKDWNWSMLEPYIQVGYGLEYTQVIMSQAYVKLAQRYLAAGNRALAILAYKWALALDSSNLVAEQGMKQLES